MRWLTVLRRRYSPSAFLFASVLAVGLLLLLEAFVLAHYFGTDVISSLTYVPIDIRCLSADTVDQAIGVHCFGDYYQVVGFSFDANPWVQGTSNYPAAGMLPQLIFGSVGRLFGAPRSGLIAYLFFLAAALTVPAAWAVRGKTVAMKIIVLGAFGLVSLPALMTLDRGNSVGFAVPALLAYLVALRRDRPWIAVIAIVIACIIKPQFVLLIVVLFAQRRWRHAFVAIGGVVVTNLMAFALWPRDFPSTLVSAAKNILGFGGGSSLQNLYPPNVSLAKGIHDAIIVVELALREKPLDAGWFDSHATVITGLIVVLLMAAVFLLGRRLPPILGGVILMMSASLFAGYSASYYLVFGLAAAAVLLRDPIDARPDPFRWRGALDQERTGTFRAVAVLLVTIAVAASIVRLIVPVGFTIYLQGNGKITDLLLTTASLTPLLWVVAAVATLAAWSFRSTESVSIDSDVSIRPREEY